MGDVPPLQIGPGWRRFGIEILEASFFIGVPASLLFGFVWSFMLSVKVTEPLGSLAIASGVTCGWFAWLAGRSGAKTPRPVAVSLPLLLSLVLLPGPGFAAVKREWYPLAIYAAAIILAALCVTGREFIHTRFRRGPLRGAEAHPGPSVTALPAAPIVRQVHEGIRFELEPLGFIQRSYVATEAGVAVATLTRSWLADRGEIAVGAMRFRVGRTGVRSDRFTLTDGRGLVAQATQRDPQKSELVLEHGARSYTVARGTTSVVVESNGFQLGNLRLRGPFQFRVVGDLSQDLPLPVRVFSAWIALVSWKRSARSEGGCG